MKHPVIPILVVALSLLTVSAHAKKNETPPRDDVHYKTANFNELSNGAFADELHDKWVKVEVGFGSLDTRYSTLVPWAKKKVARNGLFFYVIDADAGRVHNEVSPGVLLPNGYEGVFLDPADRSMASDLKPGQKITLFGKAQRFSVKTTPMMPPETHTLLRVVRIRPQP